MQSSILSSYFCYPTTSKCIQYFRVVIPRYPIIPILSLLRTIYFDICVLICTMLHRILPEAHSTALNRSLSPR